MLLAAFLWFGNLEYRDLVDPDEGRYGEIPREMAVSGDWVTPRLNDLKYFEKPPLQYWITASLYRLFGVEEWVARLWPALAGLAGALLVLVTGSRIYDRRSAATGALMLLGMVHYALFAHVLTLDMSVTLFLSATVLAMATALRDGVDRGGRRRWMLFAWAAAAGAVLTKGLIGVVLPIATLLGYALLARDSRVFSRLHAGLGIAIFVVLCVPWFVLVTIRNPEFAHFFFWHEHFERFLQAGHNRPGPWWYFVPIFVVGTMPFLGLCLWSARHWWRADGEMDFRPSRFLALWVAIVFLFFSASSSKLPAYILPLFPALALLTAVHARALSSRLLAALLMFWTPLIAVLAWLVPYAAGSVHLQGFADYFRDYVPWLEAGLAVLGLSLLAAGAVALRGRQFGAIAGAAFGSLAAVTLAMTGHQVMSPIYSTDKSFHKIAADLADASPGVPFFSVGMFDPSLTFELERPVILVAHRGELGLGLDAEPQKGIRTLRLFSEIWSPADDGFAVMRPETYVKLKAEGVPMFVLAEDPRHTLVRRHISHGAIHDLTPGEQATTPWHPTN